MISTGLCEGMTESGGATGAVLGARASGFQGLGLRTRIGQQIASALC